MAKIMKTLTEEAEVARCHHLMSSLWNMRKSIKENDPEVVTDERRICAHKLILQASLTKFSSGSVGCNPDQLNSLTPHIPKFEGLDEETVEAIMDFIYTGNVESLTSEERLKKVICVAHDVGFEILEQYCFDVLKTMVRPNICTELWKIAEHCNNSMLKSLICNCLTKNFDDVIATTAFMNFTVDQLKALLVYFKNEALLLDELLVRILTWLKNDTEQRQNCAAELFALIDPKLVSQDCLNVIVNDDKKRGREGLIQLTEIGTLLNKLIASVHIETNPFRLPLDAKRFIEVKALCHGMKLTVVSKYKLEYYIDEDRNCLSTRKIETLTVQQFDVSSMRWLPSAMLPDRNYEGAAMCQYKHFLCIAGGALEDRYIMYDIANELKETVQPFNIKVPSRTESRLCVFRGQLYIIGGQFDHELLQTVYCTTPFSGDWNQVVGLKHPQASPTVLTSSDFIYVIYQSDQSSEVVLEQLYCADGFDYLTGRNIITLSSLIIPKGIKMDFFISHGQLCGLYCNDDSCFHVISYDASKRRWMGERHHTKSIKVLKSFRNFHVKCLCNVLTLEGTQNSMLLVTTQSCQPFTLPDCLWDPLDNKLFPLPTHRGQRTIELYGSEFYAVCDTKISMFEKVFFYAVMGSLSLVLNAHECEVLSLMVLCLITIGIHIV